MATGGLRLLALATFTLMLMVAGSSSPGQDIVVDFEDGNLDRWVVVDEPPENLGDQGPSTWDIVDSATELEGKVLTQSDNIWGEPADHMLMGTIIYLADRQYTNFKMEVDVVATDNDGLGPVWAYTELDSHYRIQLMNDRWPELPPIDGYNGPMLIAHKRISNETPWYELLEVVESADYIPYPQGSLMHWTLEVVDGNFTFTSRDDFSGDENTISGSDNSYASGYVGLQLYAMSGVEFDNFTITELGTSRLQAGDADQDLDFDQLDLVKVQIAAKYLTGQAATWGEGDWNGAPGGQPGSPPPGNGRFDQLDIIAALSPGHYLKGPYAAINRGGRLGDAQTSVGYNAITGEVFVDAPAGTNLTSVNIDSAARIFTGAPAQNLGGSFDNDSDNNIFKATFGSSFGSLSFGNVAQPGLAESFVLNDLTVVGSLAGGGALGNVDLVYVPEPGAVVLLTLGLACLGVCLQVGTTPARRGAR
jgi:hypothetical protein